MAGVNQFEDLIAWQKARAFTKAIHGLIRASKLAKDYELRNQIWRATISIMSNIAEGFERVNPNEFHHFLVIAKASCAEVRSQLYIALDTECITQDEFSTLNAQAQDLARTIGALRASVDRYRKH